MGNKNGRLSASDSIPYDIFINHRGPDVKAYFATDLYHRLDACGFQVFLDKPKMQVGRHIDGHLKQVIKTTSIHIAIFSPTYAKSIWCLRELHEILKSCKSDRAILLPVFYGVKPSEVRSMANGLRVEAPLGHEINSKTIQVWRRDLYHAAGISGFELEACNNSDEELLGEIVGRVLDMREKKRLKRVTRENFDSIVLSHENIQHSSRAKVVGIIGPGGVGKTTLVQEFFDTKRSGYNRSCFLSDVKENTTEGSRISMQKKLIKDLTQLDVQIDTIDQGMNILKSHISSTNVLIILDDAAQMDAVLPIRDVLGSGSFILVTSRHKKVFESRITELSIYNLMGLNTESPRTKLVLAGHWLEKLPPWLNQLPSLKELWLRDSPNLNQSGSLQPLNELTELTIMDCGIQSLLQPLEKMNNLKVLRVYNCPLGKLSFGKKSLLELSNPFPHGVSPNLQHLWINSCRDLVKVKSLPTALITLDLSYCDRLRQIQGLNYLARLERLDISGCEEVEQLSTIDGLTSLKELKASRCYKLKRIKGLANLGTKLRILYVRECREILKLKGVERLMSLERLDASRCPKLQLGSKVLAELRQRLKAGLLI